MQNPDSNLFSFSILEDANTAFVIVKADLSIVYANPATEYLFLQSTQRLYQTTLHQLSSFYGFKIFSIEDVFITKNAFTDNEVVFIIDRKEVIVELTATYMSFDNEAHVIIEMRRIDHLKQINKAHYQAHQQKVAQQLVRGLAHEIKNPLGGLRGAAQLLEAELPNPDLKEFTQIIIEQADRLSALVDRLLGPNTIGETSLINIHAILERVNRLVSLDLANDITLKIDYDPSIPEIQVQPDLLEQALLNIIQNAVQALSENKIDLDPIIKPQIILKTRTASQVVINGLHHKLACEIKIIDNGPGIPKKLKDTLFYPMVTGRNTGTGLGLSIAQELIKQHHGRIECQSIAGHTEFTIYLPL